MDGTVVEEVTAVTHRFTRRLFRHAVDHGSSGGPNRPFAG